MDREKEQKKIPGMGDFPGNPSPDDPFDFAKIVRNPDGSLTRPSSIPDVPPQIQPPPQTNQQTPYVLSKDVPLSPSKNTWLRIYRPHLLTPITTQLPIIVYIHGGGFILFSAASALVHDWCERLAIHVPAIIVSVEYRLAPEHRLPAAYEDAIDAIRWVRNQVVSDAAAADAEGEAWMAPDIADFSRCFIMGCSSGGNIAYHAALRAAELQQASPDHHRPLKIAGVILDQAYFGGVRRTESEMRLEHDRILPLVANDMMWELALPEEADRDHEFSNPTAATAKGKEELRVGWLPPVFVRGCGDDPLVDRQRELARMLEARGVKVECKFEEDGYHAIHFVEELRREAMFTQVTDFVSSVSSSLSA